jgi:hypothetical protein
MLRLALLGLLLAGAQADPGTWRAGLASVKLTPDRPVLMAGYGGRNKPYEKVTLDVWAKALALEDFEGRRAVLVTADLCDVPAAVIEPIAAQLREKAGLSREQFAFNEAHNHSGPLVGLDLAELEGFTGGDARNTIAYTKEVQEKVVALVLAALKRLEPARLSWGSGAAPFVMNRREFTSRGVILGDNPRGLADRSVPVLRVDGADGKLRAALFGCACHNTTLGGRNYELSGDYAGFAQGAVEESHPGAQAMFVIGCAGDANPWPRGTMDLAREHGATLGREVNRILQGKLQPLRGPLRTLFERAELPLQEPGREELAEMAKKGPGYKAGNAKQMLALLEKGQAPPKSYAAPFAVWQFGNDLTVALLSGEVVAGYVPLLERALGPLNLWVAAYTNDTHGYVPTAKVLEEGGYETRGIFTGSVGFFAPRTQEVLVEKVRDLARRAGRATP